MKYKIELPLGETYQGKSTILAEGYWVNNILEALKIEEIQLPYDTKLSFSSQEGDRKELLRRYRREHRKFSQAKLYLHHSGKGKDQKEPLSLWQERLAALSCLSVFEEIPQGGLLLQIKVGYRRGSSGRKAAPLSPEEIRNREVKLQAAMRVKGLLEGQPSLSSPNIPLEVIRRDLPLLPESVQAEILEMLEINEENIKRGQEPVFSEREVSEAFQEGRSQSHG